ncbi:MAG TPA: helix-turn-helix transcriptional regulator, partial [Candidatus Limnocylindrales bacterium]
GRRRATYLLRRLGEELRLLRVAAGASTRRVGGMLGISHTQVRRIEAGLAPRVDIDLLARMASILGGELSLSVHPHGPPVRDKGHIALLARFAARLAATISWRTEVPIPLPGDPRSADGVAGGTNVDAVVEAETRLDDVQAVVRRLRAKQRDLGTRRAILLLADSRHNRAIVREIPALRDEFPVVPRACLLALRRDEDPGGDCLLLM